MVLVEYSESEESEDQDVSLTTVTSDHDAQKLPRTNKRKRTSEDDQIVASAQPMNTLPPLPSTFRDLYATNTRGSVQDDPNLHGGRKRQMPHVEGNWPTHVYLEWYPCPAESAILSKLISDVKSQLLPDTPENTVHSLLQTDLGVQAPLHISLSRTLALVGEQRYAFPNTLKDNLQNTNVRPFDIIISGLNWVPNFERNRWFLVLQLGQPDQNELNKLLLACNATASAFRQPSLYDGDMSRTEIKFPKPAIRNRDIADHSTRFHISIAWSLNESSMTNVSKTLINSKASHLEDLAVHIDSVKAKIGNVVESIPLGGQKDAGIGGV